MLQGPASLWWKYTHSEGMRNMHLDKAGGILRLIDTAGKAQYCYMAHKTGNLKESSKFLAW